MSRSLSQTLIRFSNSLSYSSPSTITTASRFAGFRHRSSSPEIFSGEVPTDEIERVAVKNLEDAIHSMIVKRSQPDWIPLVPGASYWVPPKSKSQGLAHIIRKLANDSTTTTSMIKDKSLSLSSNRGWPSSAHFFKGTSHSPLEGERISKHTSQSEDEEGHPPTVNYSWKRWKLERCTRDLRQLMHGWSAERERMRKQPDSSEMRAAEHRFISR